MITAAMLLTALLFGGMVLYSFGFAAFLFTALPPEIAGPTIRRAFSHFYLMVIITAAFAAILTLQLNAAPAIGLAAIALTTVPTRQILMPAINRATDSGQKSRFKYLHGLSVVITLAHIAIAGWVLTQFLALSGAAAA